MAQEIVRAATVHWEGDVARGQGTITTESGIVKAHYSYGTRFQSEPGTNPEELLGAAHAACFTMALAAALTRAGHAPASVDTTAYVHLAQTSTGFEISSIELNTIAKVPEISDDDFMQFASKAKESCPISLALRSVPMSLRATLSK